MTEREYLIALSTFTPFGPVRTSLLIKYFKTAKNIWTAKDSSLQEIGLGDKNIRNFIDHRNKFDIKAYFKRLDELAIDVVTIFEDGYPSNLKEISDPPFVLYIRGKLEKTDSRAVAVVGTRMMTNYGKDATEKISTELANFDVTIVSGLALGVDAVAQKSAISAGGRTIAVLASGLDIITPLTNKSLALELIKGNGAIVSEYPLGHIPFKNDFAVRNRLISGLSKAVVVVEGRIKSGTFYTVDAAANQGRPVFAVPGPITSVTSEGPNYLIQSGAKLITSARDVMEELNMQAVVDLEFSKKVMPSDEMEAQILEILECEALHLDEVVRISGRKTSEVSGRLTIMEMKGLVKNVGGSVYRKI